jgi:hypothetical protein
MARNLNPRYCLPQGLQRALVVDRQPSQTARVRRGRPHAGGSPRRGRPWPGALVRDATRCGIGF